MSWSSASPGRCRILHAVSLDCGHGVAKPWARLQGKAGIHQGVLSTRMLPQLCVVLAGSCCIPRDRGRGAGSRGSIGSREDTVEQR